MSKRKRRAVKKLTGPPLGVGEQNWFWWSHVTCEGTLCFFASGNIVLSVRNPRYSQRSVVFSNPKLTDSVECSLESSEDWVLALAVLLQPAPMFQEPVSRETTGDGASHIPRWKYLRNLWYSPELMNFGIVRLQLFTYKQTKWISEKKLWIVLFHNSENIKYPIL